MRCYWPEEFYAAMLNAFIENSDKTRAYLNQANRCHIDILPPDVNMSECKFIGYPGSIRIGLRGISGIKSAAETIVKERSRNGNFTDLQDLYERLARAGEGMTKKSAEGLIYSGALASFSKNKAALYEQYELIDKDYKANTQNRVLDQFSMFSAEEMKLPFPDVPPMERSNELAREYAVLGFHLSEHPTDKILKELVPPPGYISLPKLATLQDRTKSRAVITVGLIKKCKPFYTKNGDEMASFTLETKFATIPAIVFPKNLTVCKAGIIENAVMAVWGDYVYDERHENMQLIVTRIADPKVFVPETTNPVIISIQNKEEQEAVLGYIKNNSGSTPVILEYSGKRYPLKVGINYNASAIDFIQAMENKRIS